MNRLALTACLLVLAACGEEPQRLEPKAPAVAAPATAPADPLLEAARVLLRHQRSRIDGTTPPASWPAPTDVRRVGENAWVVEIDTSRLPSGYPQQLIVELGVAGGHSGRPLR